MSNAQKKKAGYKCPPVHHQFSSTNQPKRRRRKAKAYEPHDFVKHLLDAMTQEISITKNGKAGKSVVMAAFAQQLVGQALKGTVKDKIVLIEYLRKVGGLDFLKLKEEFHKEHTQDLEEEQAKYSELLRFYFETIEISTLLLGHRDFAASTFLSAKEKCSCDAFDGFEAAADDFNEWLSEAAADEDDDDNLESEGSGSDELNWRPGPGSVFGSQADEPAFKIIKNTGFDGLDPDDDFD